MINIMNPFARASVKALWDASAPIPATNISVAFKSSRLSPAAQVFAPAWSLSPSLRSSSVASTSSSLQSETTSAAASSPAAIKSPLSPRALPFFIPSADEESEADDCSAASVDEIAAAIYASPEALSFVPLILARDAAYDLVSSYYFAVVELQAMLELQDQLGQVHAGMVADLERLVYEHNCAVDAFGATVDAWNAALYEHDAEASIAALYEHHVAASEAALDEPLPNYFDL